jgi:hypothetical protein
VLQIREVYSGLIQDLVFFHHPDPEEEGKFLPFFVAINFSKLKIILFLNRYRKKCKKIEDIFLIFIFCPKVASKLSEIRMGCRSEIRNKLNPDSGSRGHKASDP